MPTTTSARFAAPCWRHTRIALVCAAPAALLPAAAAADDIPLTFFNGNWVGTGTDRGTASQPFQNTQCTAQATADQTRMRSRTICNGDKGLHKQTDISINLRERTISGELRMESNTFPYRFSGSISGSRTADAAIISVHSFLLGTVATISLKLIDGKSYRLSVTDGDTLLTRTRFMRR